MSPTPRAKPVSTVHACPPRGSASTPCCQRIVLELPLGDRLSQAPELVTCRPDPLASARARTAQAQQALEAAKQNLEQARRQLAEALRAEAEQDQP